MSAAAVSSGLFSACISKFAINPGNGEVFAWLADMAGLFDTYQFEKLEFIYNPAVGTDQDGKMLMTFDPDILDGTPDSKQEMLEARAQSDTAPYAMASLRVPKDVLGRERYNRRGSVPVGADPHEYDAGLLYVATPGVPAGMQGELFVSYRVKFRSPNAAPQLGGLFQVVSPSVAAPLGTSLTIANESNLLVSWVSGTTFTVPVPGIYLFRKTDTGTTFSGVATVTPTAPNQVLKYTPVLDGVQVATVTQTVVVLQVVQPEAIFTITAPSGASTLTLSRISIMPYNPDLSF
jgi:hypothetical protein